MAKKAYIGVNGVARNIPKMYAGDNIARKITKGYVGVNGVARQCFSTGLYYEPYTSSGNPNYVTVSELSVTRTNEGVLLKASAANRINLAENVEARAMAAIRLLPAKDVAGKQCTIEYKFTGDVATEASVLWSTGASNYRWLTSPTRTTYTFTFPNTVEEYNEFWSPQLNVRVAGGGNTGGTGTRTSELLIYSLTIGDEKLI